LDYIPLAIIAMTLLGIHFFLVKLMSRNIGGPAIALFAQLLIVVVLACYIYFSDTPFLPEGGKYIVPTLLASLWDSHSVYGNREGASVGRNACFFS
jgi:hypothetical protein